MDNIFQIYLSFRHGRETRLPFNVRTYSRSRSIVQQFRRIEFKVRMFSWKYTIIFDAHVCTDTVLYRAVERKRDTAIGTYRIKSKSKYVCSIKYN